MGQLLDLADFLSVLFRAGALVFQSLVFGGAVFLAYVVSPDVETSDRESVQRCRLMVQRCAAALLTVHVLSTTMNVATLAETAHLRVIDISQAAFFWAGVAGALISGAVVVLTAQDRGSRWGLVALASAGMAVLVGTSHATGRFENRGVLWALAAVHQSAAASWIGGLFHLAACLARSKDAERAHQLCRRFSRLAIVSVAAVSASGYAMSLFYVGSIEALYGTSYGIMIASKVALFGAALLLGALNHRAVWHWAGARRAALTRIRRIAEAEAGIGITVVLAAASLTSQPPAVDLPADRLVSAEYIVERTKPRPPRLKTPSHERLSPATPLSIDSGASDVVNMENVNDIAWSEYNHHWSGLIVLTIGFLATLSRYGVARRARHWPLGFLALSVFILVRADPENWPLGPRGFWESFAVVEVLQHRLFALLTFLFAVFEWSVQNGHIRARAAALVFPVVCAAGGALLLTHAHPLGNPRDAFLAELSHLPLAVLAVMAGWSRWLEVRLAGDRQEIPPTIWPVCFTLIGLVLLVYREQ